MSAQATELVATLGLVDPALALGDYNARFAAWSTPQAGHASPGRAWRLETGRDSSAQGAGKPFYPELITAPAAASVAAPPARAEREPTAALALSGLELVTHFPAPTSRPLVSSLTAPASMRRAAELAFRTVRDLGYGDLLFQAAAASGAAASFHDFENRRASSAGALDPRIAAIFHHCGWK
jgi:hypothetical protein